MKRIVIFGALLLLSLQPSCLVVGGGYSNRSGWVFFPGGLLGLLVIIGVALLLAKRRRR